MDMFCQEHYQSPSMALKFLNNYNAYSFFHTRLTIEFEAVFATALYC
jgi:hypothetical protein